MSQVNSAGLFAGKVALVTGAGNGIGRAEALYLAQEGASVVVNDIGGGRDGSGKSQQAAEAVVEEIQAMGGKAVANTQSVSDLDGAESVVWSALGRFKRVDILVNNAGILRDKTCINMNEAEWDAVIAVHLKGSFLMSRAFARAAKMQGTGGAIVNTTSLSGLLGNYGQANYSAAKAGIYGLTRTTSVEFAKFNVRVNAIAPVALTRMTEDVPMLKDMGVDAMGPKHIAPVVAWLASDLAESVSGRIFGVHGAKVFEYEMQQSDGLDTPPEGDVWTPQMLQDNLKNISI
ncbi:MAG: SDR family NAD(P)-dependent oxidoreductase [Deltaproteobacteria bacterium]|nr:SDR family NAD(P)-dependent oxidoreductase [Deltaproteobacteria bacterium]